MEDHLSDGLLRADSSLTAAAASLASEMVVVAAAPLSASGAGAWESCMSRPEPPAPLGVVGPDEPVDR